MAKEVWTQKIKQEVFGETFGMFEEVGISVEEFAAHTDLNGEDVLKIREGGYKNVNVEDLKWITNKLGIWTDKICWNDEKTPNSFIPINPELQREKRNLFIDIFGVWTPDQRMQNLRANELDMDEEYLSEIQKNGPWSIRYETLFLYSDRLAEKKNTK